MKFRLPHITPEITCTIGAWIAAAIVSIFITIPFIFFKSDQIACFVTSSYCPIYKKSEQAAAIIKIGHNWWGSAIYIGNGNFLTAKHNVNRIKIEAIETEKITFRGHITVIWQCSICDLAIVHVDSKLVDMLPTIELACRKPKVGEPIVYSGRPRTAFFGGQRFFTVRGRVLSNEFGKVGERRLFPFYGHVDKGSSGSGVIGEDGEIIGVISEIFESIYSTPFGSFQSHYDLGYAEPIDETACELMKNFLD